MTHLLDDAVRPSAGSYGADPFEPHEIDEQVNGDRIWATIMGLRQEAENAVYRIKESNDAKNDQDELDVQNIDLAEQAWDEFTALRKSFTLKDFNKFEATFEKMCQALKG